MKTFLLLLLSTLSLVAQTGLRSPAFVGQLRPAAGGGATVLPLELVSDAAAGAYSVSRLLTNAYTGALALVVRSSDGATNYLTGTATGNNIAAITTWAGSDMVYVTNLFDQTGNDRHLVNGDTNSCFTIITNGVAVTQNGKTVMDRVSSSSVLTKTFANIPVPLTYLGSVYNDSSTVGSFIFGGFNSTGAMVKQGGATYRITSGANVTVGTLTVEQWDILRVKFLPVATAPDEIAIDGGTAATGEAGNNGANGFTIGGSTLCADMMVGCWMIWNADVDNTQLANARDNVNTFLAIY